MHVGDVRQEVDEREVDGDEPLRVEPRVEVLAREAAERRLVAVLAHERLRDAHAREALLQVRVDRGDALAGSVVGARPTRTRNQTSRRRSGGRRSSTASASCQFMNDERDRTPTNVTRFTSALTSPFCSSCDERVDVGGHAGHDPARHLVLVVVDAEPLEVGEDLDAQRVQQPLGGAAHHAGRAHITHQSTSVTDEERRRRDAQHAP